MTRDRTIDPYTETCVICGAPAVELCIWTGGRQGGTVRDFCAACVESGANEDNFGRCYVCRDFRDHEHCIGVPCQCPCPTPDQGAREALRESARGKLTLEEQRAVGLLLTIIAFILATGCASPSAPSRPTEPPTPTGPPPAVMATVTGSVVATNAGRPLAGAEVDLAGVSAVTDATGRFQVQTALGLLPVTVRSSEGVPRRSWVRVDGDREVALEMFAAPFDLAYYRALARGRLHGDGHYRPLRRWLEAPKVYVRTIDEAGGAIDRGHVEHVARLLIDTTGAWTGGRFGVAALEMGTGRPEGWLTVRWHRGADSRGFCGYADIGGASIELYPDTPGCLCGGRIRPRLVRHELGHAMGMWHTDVAADVMYQTASTCDAPLSAKEREYAGYVYGRPEGNLDPDDDPMEPVRLTPVRVP